MPLRHPATLTGLRLLLIAGAAPLAASAASMTAAPQITSPSCPAGDCRPAMRDGRGHGLPLSVSADTDEHGTAGGFDPCAPLPAQDDGSAGEEAATSAEPATCRVRMTVSPEGFTMTHTPDGDFTEYDHPGPGATYVGVDRMAMHDPGGQGWVEFPGQMSGMMRNGPAGSGPMDMFDPGEIDESLYMARMPRYLAEALGWERMLARRDSPEMQDAPAVDKEVPCPGGQTGCASLQVELRDQGGGVTYAGTVTYDSRHRVVHLPLRDGSEITFSYGDLDIGRPPGW